VMRAAGYGRHGCRLRGLIVVLWRAALRIHEALALNESDLDHRRGARAPRQGRPPPRGRHGRVGVGAPAAVDRSAPRAPGWPPVLRHQLADTRAIMVIGRRARRAAPHGRDLGRSPTLRPPAAPPRPRRRDGARGCAAHRHPTPTRPQQPSASPRSTSKASTTPKSSTRSTPAAHRWSPSAPRSHSDARGPVARRALRHSAGTPACT
jgi:hypothetical protein